MGILVQSGVVVLPAHVFAWSVTVILPINSAINPYLYTIAYIISNRRKQSQESSLRNCKLEHSKDGELKTSPTQEMSSHEPTAETSIK